MSFASRRAIFLHSVAISCCPAVLACLFLAACEKSTGYPPEAQSVCSSGIKAIAKYPAHLGDLEVAVTGVTRVLSESFGQPSGRFPAEYFKSIPRPTERKIFPTEESEGGYVFEVNDGTNPVALTLALEPFGEVMCEHGENRPTRYSRSKSSVTLPLK